MAEAPTLADSSPVVVGLDGSPAAAAAFRVALREARCRSVRLVVVHAWLVTDPGLPLDTPPSLTAATERQLEKALAAYVDALLEGQGPVVVEQRVVYGAPARVLSEVSKDACLLVVGARGIGAVRGALLGSVSRHVLEHAACPVVVTQPEARTPRRVVVGLDGSPASMQALRWGASRARRDELPLVALHAWPPVGGPLVSALAGHTSARDRARQAEERLDGWVRDALGPKRAKDVDRICTPGHPAALLRAATGPDDVVYVGHRGAGGLLDKRLGSVARKVVTHARGTVVVLVGSRAVPPSDLDDGAAVAAQTVVRPPGYPEGLVHDVVLADGRIVHVRPVVPADVIGLREALARADAETIRRRFLGGGPPKTQDGLARLVTVDYVRRFAVAAFAPDGSGVGIARYEGESTWPVVDVAVAVDPRWRGVGLGRELMTVVVRRAAEQGATRLSADFFVENFQVQDLLREAGLPEQRTIDGGVVQDVILLGVAAGDEQARPSEGVLSPNVTSM